MPTVTFLTDNLVVEAQDDERLLEVCMRSEASVPFGCQDGKCGTCIISVRKGAEHLNPIGEKERATLAIYGATEQHRLACQCRVRGDVDIEQA